MNLERRSKVIVAKYNNVLGLDRGPAIVDIYVYRLSR